ncbi:MULTISPECIES: DUF6879 family protein [unclassified Pseudonocardia]|uniref:DUF6879 family protein n=1 Tax=unclassified Pseudonocardia TaxID=2619320 RepID=UPI000761DAF1|nr:MULTISPECIES: DUF6879 family protein [unclassified Pseudonocardia]
MRFPSALLGGFETARESIFRLETLDFYAGDPNAERHRTGGSWLDTPSKDDWCRLVRRRTAEGVVMRRVHLVRRPLSAYLRYRIDWSNPLNIAAGEDCRIVEAGIDGATDFWMFDDEVAWLMRYDAGGDLRAVESAAPDDLARCREWKRRAVDLALLAESGR